jgi:hypothetical protein
LICLISIICVLLHFNGTLITQMIMIGYDFIISVICVLLLILKNYPLT